MKAISVVFLTILIAATSCNSKNQKADAYGNFTSTEILLSAETAGKIIVKNIYEGQKVKQGEEAYLIDTLQNNFKKDELLARKRSVLAKKINLDAQAGVLMEQKKTLQNDNQRFENMLKEGAATQKQLDDISSQLRVIDKQVEQIHTNTISIDAEAQAIDASLEQISDLLFRSKVLVPTDGTVLETYVEVGESVVPGKALFKLANLDIMELKAYFTGDQLPLLQIGKKVEVFTDNGTGGITTLEGTISWISSEAEFTPKIIQTRKERVDMVYAVKIAVKNDGSIKLNMPGEVKIR